MSEQNSEQPAWPSPNVPDELREQREQIDALDTEILRLLNQRVQCALRVGHIKRTHGLPYFDPSRERAIYERLRARNVEIFPDSKLPPLAITAIYREIISACRNAEHPVRVAFLGPSGTNTQEAAVQVFGSAFTPLPCGTPDEVCNAVARGAGGDSENGADFGVVAIENSIHGLVSPTLDLLADSPLTICAEIELVIHHCLLSNSELGSITAVYSHEQALAQCRTWLRNHLPGARLVPVTSTARGAEIAVEERGAAAISSALAANIYGLQIVARNIEDLATNRTRFFVVGPQSAAPKPTGRDKTSLSFLVPHKPGALADVLEVLRHHGVNLSMIQSRPSRQQAWEYRFFADLQGHVEDEIVQAALEDLRQHTVSYKVMGSYPEA
jgi:chorismate mutase / prephenate dehydratase